MLCARRAKPACPGVCGAGALRRESAEGPHAAAWLGTKRWAAASAYGWGRREGLVSVTPDLTREAGRGTLNSARRRRLTGWDCRSGGVISRRGRSSDPPASAAGWRTPTGRPSRLSVRIAAGARPGPCGSSACSGSWARCSSRDQGPPRRCLRAGWQGDIVPCLVVVLPGRRPGGGGHGRPPGSARCLLRPWLRPCQQGGEPLPVEAQDPGCAGSLRVPVRAGPARCPCAGRARCWPAACVARQPVYRSCT